MKLYTVSVVLVLMFMHAKGDEEIDKLDKLIQKVKDLVVETKKIKSNIHRKQDEVHRKTEQEIDEELCEKDNSSYVCTAGYGTDIIEDPMYDNNKRAVIKNTKYRKLWNNAIVPYQFHQKVNDRTKRVFKQAVTVMYQKTKVYWRPKLSTDKFFVLVQTVDPGCYSSVGELHLRQPKLNLGPGCVYQGIVLHEMMHSMGFFHEQSRPDRDEFIEVIWDNIPTSRKHNFFKKTYLRTHGEYDYRSILHYRLTAFSKNGKPTMRLKKSFTGYVGNRYNLSYGDIKEVKHYYGPLMKDCRTIACGKNEYCRVADFKCICPGGYIKINGVCGDINECDGAHLCHENAVCVNRNGGYGCNCKPGFRRTGLQCIDIDECDVGQHNCTKQQLCHNKKGGFQCIDRLQMDFAGLCNSSLVNCQREGNGLILPCNKDKCTFSFTINFPIDEEKSEAIPKGKYKYCVNWEIESAKKPYVYGLITAYAFLKNSRIGLFGSDERVFSRRIMNINNGLMKKEKREMIFYNRLLSAPIDSEISIDFFVGQNGEPIVEKKVTNFRLEIADETSSCVLGIV